MKNWWWQQTNKFKNHLLSIRAEHQRRIRSNLHPIYNAYHEKIVELINWTLETYRAANIHKTQQNEEQIIIIDNITDELDKERDITINKKNRSLLKDKVLMYRQVEEDTLIIFFL
jgi:hypothetical protein